MEENQQQPEGSPQGDFCLDAKIKELADIQAKEVPPVATEQPSEEEKAFSQGSNDLDSAMKRAQIKESEAKSGALRVDTRLKIRLARHVFRFMQAWCTYVAIIFLTYFFLKDGDVPAEVMIALLTGTTVSVIGLVGFIVQGLFKSGENKPQ
ncbi:TPA: hypothetical protein ACW7Y0_003931 [Aeromonas hydrophila]